ncbi:MULTISPECIES: ABC transporter permease [Methylorubrum]|uniref:Polysialic acid transport protein KpsM n=1 Tax=Methylorubrum suomiense TaxID=144191 RepID=A0ABQ4UUU2_9HYPH|nr:MULTISPECIES: ABC transporter [Methylobacteriaceae]GJE75960.1 Polysialic acid transport protein KpsM [Methylorubrum suomiense]
MNLQPPTALIRRSQTDIYLQVLNALILRDMRSRFGGSYWGYLVQMLWPVAHVILIVGIMVFREVPSPMGDSTMLFVASGAFPLLAFKYISREMMKGYLVHKSLTWFPQVKRIDTMVARAVVEICSSFMGFGVICLFLLAFGVDPIPVDITTAMTGYIAAIALGISVGTVNVGIVSIFPPWQIIYILVVLLVYFSSGLMFVAAYMPEQIYSLMRWNPCVQIVEWVRLGYEPSLPIQIDYLYILGWIFGSLTVGLLMERYVMER